MLLFGIILILVGLYIIIVLFDFSRKYKLNHAKIRCNKCGSEDTVVKNNDTEDIYNYHGREIKYLERNPPSFYCNHCQKEYDCKEGTWLKKHR